MKTALTNLVAAWNAYLVAPSSVSLLRDGMSTDEVLETLNVAAGPERALKAAYAVVVLQLSEHGRRTGAVRMGAIRVQAEVEAKFFHRMNDAERAATIREWEARIAEFS